MVDRQGHLRPAAPTGRDLDELSHEFVKLYERTKGIHRRLNGRRLHADS